MASHQNGLADIDKLMDADRKRQEADMDAMLRARLDRRRKRAQGKNKDEIKQELKEIEADINDAIEADKEH